MKTTTMILMCLMAMLTLIAVSALAQVTLSNDVGTVEYKGGVFASAGLRGVQDAVPAIAVLSWPDPSAVTTQIVVRILDDMSKTNATTNVVQNSAFIPTKWDTTLWPIATPGGVAYRIAVITNSTTAGTSNWWFNVTGSTNGWIKIQ